MGTQSSMTRRSFVKMGVAAAGAAALGAALGTSSLVERAKADEGATDDTKVIRTCCRACGKNECGVLVTVKNGRAVKIQGDSEGAWHSMGNCCTKSQSSIQACYHPARLYHPMKRTNPKGDADPGWVRISWEEANQTIAEKFRELIDKYGGESILTMEGTSRHWTQFGSSAWMQLLNTPNAYTAYQVCKGPRHFATTMIGGPAYSWMATTDRPSVYVQWGGASEISNYDEAGRTTVDIAMKAQKHIVVDPRLTNLNDGDTIHLGLIPGTDGAMAMAWTWVVIENKLYDDLYVKRWTDAPFLPCDDIEPSGYECATQSAYGETFEMKTRLLKECDVKEGGSSTRFMVWDKLAGSDSDHPLHENDETGHLTWFDAETGLWEGEDADREVEFYESPQPNLPSATAPGRIAKPSTFDPDIDPAIYGEFEITLKDGTKSAVRPVWEHYRDRLADFTPEKVADTCGVPADLITEAATVYATRLDPSTGYGNGGIQYMLAVEHGCNSIDNCRVLDFLCGITGNYDTPAGMRGATTGPWKDDAMIMAFSEIDPQFAHDKPTKRLGSEKHPLLDWWTWWANSHDVMNAAATGEPYPIKGGVCQAADHMSMANSNLNYEGLKNLDFFLDIDLWLTPTAGMADIVLPGRHWLEVDCPRLSQGAVGALGATVKCVEPPADTHYDPDIILDVYRAMDQPWFQDPEHPYPESMDEYFSSKLEGYDSWEAFKEEFQEKGWVDCRAADPEGWGTYRRYELGYYGVKGFPTPTHKHEIWSTVVESYCPDMDEEIPTWIPAPRTPQADPSIVDEWPFLMTTGRRIPVYFHSEHRQLPWCRELWPVPKCEINPADAEKLGVTQGDWVWIESPQGKIRQTVDLYYGIRPGVINCEHQWWLPELDQADHGFPLVGVNCLQNGEESDRLCASAHARAYSVKVYKATAENSPFGNPVPCGDDGTEMITSATDERLKLWMPNYEIREEA